MKKVRKGQKKLIMLIIAILAIIVVTIVIINLINNRTEEPETPIDEQQVILLPETTYSDMEVKNVEMEFLKKNNETMITMEIHNTTDKKVENERVNSIWIGPNEEVLATRETYIEKLNSGESCSISIIFKGDLTSTKQIKLEKVENK